MRPIAKLLALILSGGVHAALADTTFVANITHDQEPPPVGTTPFLTSTGAARPGSIGAGTFSLNDAMTALTFSATIYNIDVTGSQTPDTFDNLAAAHIHGPAAPGVNAGVRWGFFGAPFNDTSPTNTVLTPFANGVGGTFVGTWDLNEGQNTTLTAQLPSILNGLTYINFHTVQFGGGEIRGQIIPTSAVPDHGSIAVMLGISLLTICGLRRQLRR